jgi:hypothetical protein
VRLLVGETISNLGSTITSFAFAIVAVVMLEASPRQPDRDDGAVRSGS